MTKKEFEKFRAGGISIELSFEELSSMIKTIKRTIKAIGWLLWFIFWDL